MKKLSLIILLILCCIGVFTGLYFGMEKIARFQNNLNLYNVTQCLDLNNNLPLTTAINLCALNLRSVGITGDIFVIRKSDKLIFWDESKDAHISDPSKIFMTENGMCTLFIKPKTCLEAIEKMTSIPHGEVTWQFDDSIEWVNYITYTKNQTEYIIGQGAQFDEIDANFKFVEMLLIAFTFILIIFIIMV